MLKDGDQLDQYLHGQVRMIQYRDLSHARLIYEGGAAGAWTQWTGFGRFIY